MFSSSRLKVFVLSALILMSAASAQTLTVLTHDSFAISEEVIAKFTQETGIEVEFIAGGDAGETLNRAILTKNNPIADVLYGVDNSLLARAKAADLFEPYESPVLDQVASRYQFDPEHSLTPTNVGYVNFNIDKAYFAEQGVTPPADLMDLTQAAYKGLTVVENPATSSPGLAFMLATIARFGETGDYTWLDYWAELRDNELMVVSGWNDAYYSAFSLYGGDRPIVLSYASSPAAEVMFAEAPLSEAPTANLFCETCVFEQIEGVGILKGSKHRQEAQAFIDFMLSEDFQADIAANMFVYPVREGTPLPEAFLDYSQIPSEEESASLEPSEIEGNLKTWLLDWTRVVEQGQAPR
ncbi:MAG: thiamine ABC transporter substrate-binding protein [Trueperaceae bacterium]|nr:thiamine ABC transporter substrate-binding protein [Trueperaceae bacterium]